jgi:N-acetylglucosaminyl-diphospho-decaprenol L-rhamnosyltransferase
MSTHTQPSTGQPPVDLSIIIVNWNVRELLRQCLDSVWARGGLAAERLQVIVVDNDSKDGSAEMVAREFPAAELIANRDNLGFGKANNQALPQCRGRQVMLLNPDTLVLDGALKALVDHMDAHPDVAVTGCRLLNGDGSLQRWTGGAYPRLLNVLNHYFFLDRLLPASMRPMPLYLDHDAQQDVEVDWVSGAVMLLRADRLNGQLFNPDYFMYGEDMELCHRLKQAGGRVVYTPCASIVHYQGESMKQQQGDVLLSALKGPRQFYRQMRGDSAVWLYDLVTVGGFALRWVLYRAGALLKRGAAAQEKARSSHDLMCRAWRIMKA